MPRIEIPGIGAVDFPDEMSESAILAAAQKLHGQTNTQTASAEQFTPAPRMTRLPTDPSASGFASNLLSGAKDAVTSLPRVVKGLTQIDPLALPGQIAGGIRDRVQSYADDPLSTIYDDPLSFLGDAATVTGIGAAAGAPLRAGARGAAAAASRMAPAASAVADVGMGALEGAVKAKLPGGGGSALRGAFRGGAQRMARRGASAAEDAVSAPSSAPAGVLDDLVEGYDRYMPNSSAPTAPAPSVAARPNLPAKFGPDVAAGPAVGGGLGNSFADDAFARYTSRLNTPEQKLAHEILEMQKAAKPSAASHVRQTGKNMLTTDEQKFIDALSDRKLLPERTATNWMDFPLATNPQYFKAAAASKFLPR